MLRLAQCCALRRRRLEELAHRCDDIGLDPEDVALLANVARSYGDFHSELRRIYADLDVEAQRPIDAAGATVAEAFRDVMNSRLPRSKKRAVRRAYRTRLSPEIHAD